MSEPPRNWLRWTTYDIHRNQPNHGNVAFPLGPSLKMRLHSGEEARPYHLCAFVFSLQDFSYDDPKLEFNVDAPNGVVMEGYLFKRASNAFKTWNR